MKKILLSLFLSAAFIAPLPMLADAAAVEIPGRENRGQSRGTGRTQGSNGHSNRGNSGNQGNNPHSGSSKPNRPNTPSKPQTPSKPNKPSKPEKPHNPSHPGHVTPGRPGGNNHYHKPGRPGGAAYPGYKPYRPNPQHYPNLRKLMRGVIGNGRLINVWQFAPNAYIARYYLNGRYWMQRFYPTVGRYDTPFVVYQNGDGWYDDYNYQYYDEGNSLRVFLNGVAQSPWTLLPSFQLNINL